MSSHFLANRDKRGCKVFFAIVARGLDADAPPCFVRDYCSLPGWMTRAAAEMLLLLLTAVVTAVVQPLFNDSNISSQSSESASVHLRLCRGVTPSS
jgi:hypothetical protein